jgi:thiol-disulfide isomerase/thioredoxin
MNPLRSGRAAPGLWLVFAGLAVLLAAAYWYRSRPTSPWPSQPLTGLRFEPLTGNAAPVSSSDLLGKVALVNFWGTWCPPCRQEMPHLAALHEQYRDRDDFRLLAVSCGPPGSDENPDDMREATQAFISTLSTPLPTFIDPDFQSRLKVDAAVGLRGYPTTLLLDRQGVIRRVWVGYQPGTEQEMGLAVANLLVE